MVAGRDRVSSRRLRAVGQAPKRCADDVAAAVRRAGSHRRDASRVKFWRSVRDASPFWAGDAVGDWPLWRVSTTPARGAEFASKAAARRAVLLRLGRRPDLDRAAAVRTAPALQRSAAPRQRPAVTPRSSAPPPPPAPRSTCSSRSRARSPPSPGASRRASIPRACSTPAACGRGCDANQFLPHPARRSGHRGGERYSARLRALRLLPGDLPDLCAARRRARFAARPHLPHQGDAGARCAGDRRGGHAHRPLPLVPRLHDDVPLGRALHASGRSRPRAYRGDLHAAAARPADAAVSRPRDAVSAQASRGDDGRRARQAVRAAAWPRSG